MEYLSLREQPAGKLRDVSSSAEALLSHSEVLPTELRIKLDTLRADVAAILEDRQDCDGADSPRGPGKPKRRSQEARQMAESLTDKQIREWQASTRMDDQITAEIALWARDKERGTALPSNDEFSRNLGFTASNETYRRAKNRLVALEVLWRGDGDYSVA